MDETQGAAAGGATPQIRVLVVDDQPRVLRAVTALLESYPDVVVVGQARNGAETLGLVQHTRPDVVLMDVVMPILDGLEATRRLKQRFDVGVLLFTMHPGMQKEAAAAGADGFIVKGTPGNEMVATLRELAHARRH